MEDQRAWWMPRRLTFWDMIFISAIAAIFCGFMAFTIYRGPEYGLPRDDKLVAESGRVIYAGFAPAGRSGHITVFRLDSSPTVFAFTGVMGDYPRIKEMLCLHCEASVWVDPADGRDRPFAWQIEVNGRMIASYPDVRANWISDRRGADWMAPIAGAASIGFAVWAFRRRRQDRLDN